MKWRTIGVAIGSVGVFAFLAYMASGEAVPGDKTGDRPAAPGAATPAVDDPLIVHEWGTFTSYSGSDGGRLEFRPLFDDDLPPFVADRSQGQGFLSKTSYRALVRMETPVTYFYTREPREVQVRVGFPRGLLTEFYPPVAGMTPPYAGGKEPKTNSSLDWGTVRLIPEAQLRPALADARVADVVQRRAVVGLLPQANSENHYVYARETDSALVHVHRPPQKDKFFAPQGDFFEKFLFYRGLGDFSLPIRASAPGEGKAIVTNSGADEIAWLMLLDISSGAVRYCVLPGIPAGQQRELSLPRETSTIDSAATNLTTALIGTGLYAREAEAMVKTWRSSWFGEEGTRLLYFVPQQLTDELLPLDIQPPPAEKVRVLVGRLDLMTPERERAVTQIVHRSAIARAETHRQAQTTGIRAAYLLPDTVKQLGRLAEPALARVRHTSTDEKLVAEADLLIRDLHAAAPSQ